MKLSLSALDDGDPCRQLNLIDLDALAKETGFCRRRARKLGPALFLRGVLALGATGCQSLRQRAIVLGILSHQLLSKQALFKRCNNRAAVRFIQATLGALIGQMPCAPLLRDAASALGAFARVLIQDSTTIALHPRLARFFPGSAHPRATLSSLKIQAIFELCRSRFLGFELGSFRRNDQAASPLIVQYCAAGDLVIRDLGYFVLPVLRAIAQKNACFLSRLRANCVLYTLEGHDPLDLLAILRRQTRFDGWVRAGKEEKLPARLIAVPLPQEVAAERRRKARANRDRRLKPSKASLALLGWEIFITNAEGEHLRPEQIAALYFTDCAGESKRSSKPSRATSPSPTPPAMPAKTPWNCSSTPNCFSSRCSACAPPCPPAVPPQRAPAP